jgi:hypothetical protein
VFLSDRQAASCAIILLILPPYITVNIPDVSVILRNFFVVGVLVFLRD